MTKHLSGAIVTHLGTAANNRGETEGNITTLQKLLWNGEVHTTVSAEAIRWAVRYRWQVEGLALRRTWNDETEDYVETTNFDAAAHIDDDVMGFMLAEGAKLEGNEAESDDGSKKKGKGKDKPKGTITKRRGVLEVTRAVSLVPYAGDITFNARAGEKGSTSLYGTEVHATRYQYGFAMTPSRLKTPGRVVPTLSALLALGEVAGNHSRFLYDFSPESVVLRLSDDPSPRMLYCFEAAGEGRVEAPKLVRAVSHGDIAASGLVVGGALAEGESGAALRAAGVEVLGGVREAGARMLARLQGQVL